VCRRRPLLAATSLLLSACAAVGPDFKPSEVPWLENWSISTLPLQKLPPIRHQAVTDQWWGYFNDPVLEITLL
jgi:hypothetical protein